MSEFYNIAQFWSHPVPERTYPILEYGFEGLGASVTKTAFVVRFYPYALESEKSTGIPASFSLAQSALESGWATSKPGNMMFGIKAGSSWRGQKQLLTTKEWFSTNTQGYKFPEVISIVPNGNGYLYTVKDWFRAYPSPKDSFNDHASVLSGSRYKAAFNYTNNPAEFARRVAAAGYATDPAYSSKLVSLVNEIESIRKNLKLGVAVGASASGIIIFGLLGYFGYKALTHKD